MFSQSVFHINVEYIAICAKKMHNESEGSLSDPK